MSKKAHDYVVVPEDVRKRAINLANGTTERAAFEKLGVSSSVYHDLTSAGGMVRKEVLERVMKKLVFLGVAATILLSCASLRDSFEAAIARCELEATCAGAVQCRREVAVRFHRPLETIGRCEP